MKYRGYSVQLTRVSFRPQEFGAPTVAAAAMILTHPYREMGGAHLHCDVPGDGVFVCGKLFAPTFGFIDGHLEYGLGDADRACENFGSISLFVPTLRAY